MPRQSLLRLSVIAFLAPSLLILVLPSPAARAADNWTNLTGTSTVSGEMLGLWNGRVLLQLDGGRRVSVRMEDLRADSRIQAEKRLAEINQRLQQRSDEIRATAEEAEAPAPQNPPAVSPAPAYAPPKPGEDLRTTLTATRDQILAGHLRVLYDTLPASHQQLVAGVFTAGLAKVDADSYELARTTLQAWADLIITRQRWLLSHPRLAQLSETQQAALLDAAELIRSLTADNVLALAALRSRPFSESIAAASDAVSPHLNRLLGEQSASLGIPIPEIEVEPGREGAMIAKAVLPVIGTVSTTSYTQVEGRWVAGENAEAAANRWKEAQQALQPIADGSLRLPAAAESVIQQLAAAATSLQQAKSRQQFHRELDQLLPEFITAINTWSGYKPPRGPGYAGQYPQEDEYPGGEEMLGGSTPYATPGASLQTPGGTLGMPGGMPAPPGASIQTPGSSIQTPGSSAQSPGR